MANQFLTNYTGVTFLEKVKDNLRHCTAFHFSVSFIKKAGLVLLFKDIEAAVERGAKGRIITSTYQNFTDIESLKSFFVLQSRCSNFECHLDHECFHDSGYTTLGYHSKGYVTVLDFIGNSYKRSVQIAFALSSLADNFVLEKRLMMALVQDDFKAIGLSDYGVEINIDDLSKEEIISYIERENFNSLNYMKQDYFNFRKYIGAETYPRHMDYINNDCAPDLLRFMSIKIQGRKCVSYYNFLHGILDGIDEDARLLPVFTERQVQFANYLSAMLPLVRRHEYEIFKCVVHGMTDLSEIECTISASIAGYTHEEFEHALKYMVANGYVALENGKCALVDVQLDSDYLEYLDDLLSYGLTRYTIDYGEEVGFKLWQSYRMDQVQLKFLKNPGHNQVGTYYYDDAVVIFASLKKDASVAERLNYKDKFLEPALFQWESMANVPESDLQKLINSKVTYLFIRKVSDENGKPDKALVRFAEDGKISRIYISNDDRIKYEIDRPEGCPSDDEIEQKITELFTEYDDDSEITEYLAAHDDEYSDDIYDFAFREAIRQGITDYIENYAENFDLNDGEGYSTYLHETDDEDIQDLLMELGAFRSWDEYSDCRFAVETVNGSILAFDCEFQREVFTKYLELYGITEEDVIIMLEDEDRAEEFDSEHERFFCEEMETLGVEVANDAISFIDKVDSDGGMLRDLLEDLGWDCSFEGERWKLETNGVYFIK